MKNKHFLLLIALIIPHVTISQDDTWKKIHIAAQILASITVVAQVVTPLFCVDHVAEANKLIAQSKREQNETEKALEKCLLANKSSEDLNRHGMPTVCDEIMSHFILACGVSAFQNKANNFKFLRQSIDANPVVS